MIGSYSRNEISEQREQRRRKKRRPDVDYIYYDYLVRWSIYIINSVDKPNLHLVGFKSWVLKLCIYMQIRCFFHECFAATTTTAMRRVLISAIKIV